MGAEWGAESMCHRERTPGSAACDIMPPSSDGLGSGKNKGRLVFNPWVRDQLSPHFLNSEDTELMLSPLHPAGMLGAVPAEEEAAEAAEQMVKLMASSLPPSPGASRAVGGPGLCY